MTHPHKPRRDKSVSAELVSILAVGVALAGLTLTGLHGVRTELNSVRAELHDVRTDVGDLRERMARLEGLFEGFIQKAPANDPDSN